jgi:murein DD-endopeptidase MepM/ murein hydrolase activator NlpD
MLALILAFACGPAAPEPVHYAVKRGDTLSLVAKAHGVTVEQLKAWNHLDSDRLEVGQDLLLFSGEPAATPPAPTKKRKRKRISGTTLSAPPDDAPSEPRLELPPEQACLSGPTEVSGDDGMAASKGLDEGDVRRTMSAFVPNTLRCMTPETPSGSLDLDITVACTGRVARVEISGGSGFPPAVAGCIQDVMRYAPFPAHDLPDGYEFGYPLRYQAP